MSGRFAVRVTALAFAAAFAFTTIAAQAASSDVKGIDIIVRKKPGNAIVVHGTIGPNGSADLGNLPAGQYDLTATDNTGGRLTSYFTKMKLDKIAELTISGATAPIKTSWNFETGRPFNPAASSTARAPVSDSVPFATDGKHHVVIVVSASPNTNTTTTSRSNVRNNLQIQGSPLPRASEVKNDVQLNAMPSPTPTPRKQS